MSLTRMLREMRPASCRRTASPTRWPYVSLMALKRSMSMKATASGFEWRVGRPTPPARLRGGGQLAEECLAVGDAGETVAGGLGLHLGEVSRGAVERAGEAALGRDTRLFE